MGKYMVKRVLYIVLVFFILSFLLFMIYNMLPIDKAAEFALSSPEPDPATVLDDVFYVEEGAK